MDMPKFSIAWLFGLQKQDHESTVKFLCATIWCRRAEGVQKSVVIAADLYDNLNCCAYLVALFNQSVQEKIMEILQKLIIFAAVTFVVGGIGWFIFLSH